MLLSNIIIINISDGDDDEYNDGNDYSDDDGDDESMVEVVIRQAREEERLGLH